MKKEEEEKKKNSQLPFITDCRLTPEEINNQSREAELPSETIYKANPTITASVIHTNPRLPLKCKKSKKGAVSLSEDDETSGVCDELIAGFNMTHPNSQ